MFIIDEINRIICKNKINNLGVFIDMDGVVADYRFGEGKDIQNNVPGIYLNKRPIQTNINIIKQIQDHIDCKMHIISSCLFKEQAEEKKKWINKYMNFIKKDNIEIVIAGSFEERKTLKVTKIIDVMKLEKYDYSILIDDTHEILFLAIKMSKGKIIPFHVVTLLD